MKEKVKRGWGKSLLLLAPLALIIAMFIGFSGDFTAAASEEYSAKSPCWGYGDTDLPDANNDGYPDNWRSPIISPFGLKPAEMWADPNVPEDWWDDPDKCHSFPWGVNDNPIADALNMDPGDEPIDDILDADQAQELLANGDPANPGKEVHIIDVRVLEEQCDGIAPCLTSIGAPTFPRANSGHPIWKDAAGNWQESYHVPMFAGFYMAGTNREEGVWQPNIRPEPNPNFVALGYQDSLGTNVTLGGYFKALKDQGEIADGDTFIFMCQTGWRASYAAAIFKNLPGFENSRVINMYGGMRGWSDSVDPEKIQPIDTVGPDSGGYVIDRDYVDPQTNENTGKCAQLAGVDTESNTNNGIDDDNDGRIDENNPILDIAGAGSCDLNKRLRTLAGSAGNSDDAYKYVHAAATDPNTADRYAYNVTRLVKDGQVPMWNGTEQHVGVKPEWHTGFGSGDFKLNTIANNPRWADYGQRLLAVDYVVQNQMADYNQLDEQGRRAIPRLNYYDECGSAPVEEGGQCDTVIPAPWAPAYNVRATGANPDNGVTVEGVSSLCLPDNPVGSYCAPILPGGAGVVTVTYKVPANVTSFSGNPIVKATDIPDPKRSFFGAAFDSSALAYFAYTYSHWTPQVTVPGAPALNLNLNLKK